MAGQPAAVAAKPAETTVAGSVPEGLVNLRLDEPVREPSPAADPDRSPLRTFRPPVLAASLLGAALLGAVTFLLFRGGRGGEAAVEAKKNVAGPTRPTEPSKPQVLTDNPTRSPESGMAPLADAGRADNPPAASAPEEEARVIPAAEMSTATYDALRSSTRTVYVDEFDDPETGWRRDDFSGYAAGSYFVDPGGGWRGYNSPRHLRADGIIEVVGRPKSDEPRTAGSWGVIVNRPVEKGARGFVVRINGRGELSVAPNPWPEAKDFRDADTTLGPIFHPAIKPGGQANTLTIVLKKRTLEILVNSVLVCGPLSLSYDLAPSSFQLGAFDGQSHLRAEFDRVEVREFTDGRPSPPPTSGDPLQLASYPAFHDDFHDSNGGWPRDEGHNYANGIYYINPGHGTSYWRSPRRLRVDGTIEAVRYVKSGGRVTQGSWGIVVGKEVGTAHRGFTVRINGKGELFLATPPWFDAKNGLSTDPIFGPVVHPAIKPGDQKNSLMLVLRKRTLEILVNSVRVCEPVTFDFDLSPTHFSLGSFNGTGTFRAGVREGRDPRVLGRPTKDDPDGVQFTPVDDPRHVLRRVQRPEERVDQVGARELSQRRLFRGPGPGGAGFHVPCAPADRRSLWGPRAARAPRGRSTGGPGG